MKAFYSFCFWGLLAFLAGCMPEDVTLPSSKSEQEFNMGQHLQRLLHQSPQLRSVALQQSEGKKLLFEYVTLSHNASFGTHYKLPYKDEATNLVDGCLIFQVEEEFPFIDTQLPKQLLQPINFTVEMLEEIPQSQCYHYAAIFKQWRNAGLDVLASLTACADSMDVKEREMLKQKSASTRAMVINPDALDCAGDFLVIDIDYEMVCAPYGYGVQTLSRETVQRIADEFLTQFFQGSTFLDATAFTDIYFGSQMTIWVEKNGYFTNTVLLSLVPNFVAGLASRYVDAGLAKFLYTYKYNTYFRNFPVPEMWIDDGKDDPQVPGGGGGGTGTENTGDGEEQQPNSETQREDSIVASIFDDAFVSMLDLAGLRPEKWLSKIKIVIDFLDSRPNAQYNSLTKELRIFWERMRDKGYTSDDILAVVFHECVHVKQDFVDKIVIERNEEGEPIEESYEIRYTDAMWEKEMEEFEILLTTRNIPLDAEKRTSDQQRLYDFFYQRDMYDIEKMYREGIPSQRKYNKIKLQLDVEAYELQFLYFEGCMSPVFEEAQRGNLNSVKDIYEQIKNQ